jgi:ectoine hydroxylase-related dioxygenase (phytanoyl-CoA dioxygenase family)
MSTSFAAAMPAAYSLDLPEATGDVERNKRNLDEYGLAVHKRLFTPEQVAQLKARLQEQAELEEEQGVAQLSEGSSTGKVWIGRAGDGPKPPCWQGVPMLINKGRVFIDLGVMNPVLHEYCRHAFRNYPFMLSAMTGLIVKKGAEPMVIHTDQQFVPFPTPTPVYLNMMVCLTEFTEAMGATRVVPRSHKWNVYPKTAMGADGVPYNPETINTVPVLCGPGDVILFESRTWHQSGPSTSDNTRYSFTLLWNQSWMRPMDDIVQSLHQDVYESLPKEALALLGFRVDAAGRFEPRHPGDRQPLNRGGPYVPELTRSNGRKAVAYGAMKGGATYGYEKDTHEKHV